MLEPKITCAARLRSVAGRGVVASALVLGTLWASSLTHPALGSAGPETLVCAGDEPPPFHPDSSRIRELNIDHERVSVLLPPHYRHSKGRYPVLYLLAGGNNNQNGWLQS
ncbi:MAG TPA: hypothetical protein VHW74_13390, partial [Mycobacteriales bacterium]|nr:hypothetical protein [Mycobacteriales bacterium]